jgi:hypothetical protein
MITMKTKLLNYLNMLKTFIQTLVPRYWIKYKSLPKRKQHIVLGAVILGFIIVIYSCSSDSNDMPEGYGIDWKKDPYNAYITGEWINEKLPSGTEPPTLGSQESWLAVAANEECHELTVINPNYEQSLYLNNVIINRTKDLRQEFTERYNRVYIQPEIDEFNPENENYKETILFYYINELKNDINNQIASINNYPNRKNELIQLLESIKQLLKEAEKANNTKEISRHQEDLQNVTTRLNNLQNEISRDILNQINTQILDVLNRELIYAEIIDTDKYIKLEGQETLESLQEKLNIYQKDIEAIESNLPVYLKNKLISEITSELYRERFVWPYELPPNRPKSIYTICPKQLRVTEIQLFYNNKTVTYKAK